MKKILLIFLLFFSLNAFTQDKATGLIKLTLDSSKGGLKLNATFQTKLFHRNLNDTVYKYLFKQISDHIDYYNTNKKPMAKKMFIWKTLQL